MPIYEYLCGGCGKKFEMHRSISDESLPECPACKATTVKKLISQTAFHLKGGGWYKDGYGNTAPATSSSEAPVGNKAEKSAKPAEKSDKATAETPAASTASTDSSKKEAVKP